MAVQFAAVVVGTMNIFEISVIWLNLRKFGVFGGILVPSDTKAKAAKSGYEGLANRISIYFWSNLPIVWQVSQHSISMEGVGTDQRMLGSYAAALLHVPA